MEIVNFVMENGVQIGVILLAALKVAQEIAKITPTTKDDDFIEKYIRKPVEWIGNIGLPNLVKTRKGIKRK